MLWAVTGLHLLVIGLSAKLAEGLTLLASVILKTLPRLLLGGNRRAVHRLR
jgi:hypothetical protein